MARTTPLMGNFRGVQDRLDMAESSSSSTPTSVPARQDIHAHGDERRPGTGPLGGTSTLPY